jgi:hypothetical protein
MAAQGAWDKQPSLNLAVSTVRPERPQRSSPGHPGLEPGSPWTHLYLSFLGTRADTWAEGTGFWREGCISETPRE